MSTCARNSHCWRADFSLKGIYEFGTKLRLPVDLDGDGNDEVVSFKYSHGGFSLHILKFSSSLPLPFGEGFHAAMEEAKVLHLAAKDVNNDGLPEILLAAHDGLIDLRLFIWGFTTEARDRRSLTAECVGILGEMKGQRKAYIFEGGTIKLPYGSAGLFTEWKWNGTEFQQTDPLKTESS